MIIDYLIFTRYICLVCIMMYTERQKTEIDFQNEMLTQKKYI